MVIHRDRPGTLIVAMGNFEYAIADFKPIGNRFAFPGPPLNSTLGPGRVQLFFSFNAIS
jgi:hypothetical protein